MKKIAQIALALLIALTMMFSVACNMEEYNYLHDNLDKSNVTNEEFTEWMYNRTKTSIKLNRPNSEIKYNVELLMTYYDYLDDYLDGEAEKMIDAENDKSAHLEYYDLLSPILVEYAERVDEDKIWVGKAWRDTGRALNMTSNSEYMAVIAKQIMAKGKAVSDYYMYKDIKRSEVVEGEEIIEVVVDYDRDETTESGDDKVRVKFKDEAQANKIAQDFIQNAIFSRPTTAIGQLYVLSVMYEFSLYIGYTDAFVYEEEYHPGSGSDGENPDGTEIIRTKIPLATYYQNAYVSYVGV
ncbi:MAG: hypothetical protein J6C23_06160 [Clostridia bacterium]|nr:hypothetical protein [Clostridia bacterium]